MLTEHPVRSSSLPAELAIERLIRQRTWGRVAQLQVQRVDERIIVRGYTSSYYVKQLAIQAALEALGGVNSPHLEVDIEVGPSTAPASPGREYHFVRP